MFHQAISAIGRASTGTANKEKVPKEFPTPKTRNPPRDFSDKYAAMTLTAINAPKRRFFFFILPGPLKTVRDVEHRKQPHEPSKPSAVKKYQKTFRLSGLPISFPRKKKLKTECHPLSSALLEAHQSFCLRLKQCAGQRQAGHQVPVPRYPQYCDQFQRWCCSSRHQA
jgi:hypothetical protein